MRGAESLSPGWVWEGLVKVNLETVVCTVFSGSPEFICCSPALSELEGDPEITAVSVCGFSVLLKKHDAGTGPIQLCSCYSLNATAELPPWGSHGVLCH